MTAQQQVAQVLAVLNAPLNALDTPKTAYDVGKEPSPRPKEYVDVNVSRVFGGTPRTSSQKYLTGYRVTVRGVSELSATNARNSLEVCRAALEYKRLTVDGQESTPIQFETEDPAEPDNGWFVGLLAFTYTIRD